MNKWLLLQATESYEALKASFALSVVIQNLLMFEFPKLIYVQQRARLRSNIWRETATFQARQRALTIFSYLILTYFS